MSKFVKKSLDIIGIDMSDGKIKKSAKGKPTKVESKTPHTMTRKRSQTDTVLSGGELPPGSSNYLG